MGGLSSMKEAAEGSRDAHEKPVVLVVDDEPDLLELVSLTLSRMSLQTRTAPDINTARRLLKTERFDLCLTDMRLPDGDGLDLVAWIQENRADLPVAVITAHGNVESAVRSEEHTSELQSRLHLVCRLLLEKKKTDKASMSSEQHIQT